MNAEEIAAVLSGHGTFWLDGDDQVECTCGEPLPGDPGNAALLHNTHQAQVLAPLIRAAHRELWEAGFGKGFDAAADDIGAWAVIVDCVEDVNYDHDNPYKDPS